MVQRSIIVKNGLRAKDSVDFCGVILHTLLCGNHTACCIYETCRCNHHAVVGQAYESVLLRQNRNVADSWSRNSSARLRQSRFFFFFVMCRSYLNVVDSCFRCKTVAGPHLVLSTKRFVLFLLCTENCQQERGIKFIIHGRTDASQTVSTHCIISVALL